MNGLAAQNIRVVWKQSTKMDVGKPNTFLQLKLKEIAAGIKLLTQWHNRNACRNSGCRCSNSDRFLCSWAHFSQCDWANWRIQQTKLA